MLVFCGPNWKTWNLECMENTDMPNNLFEWKLQFAEGRHLMLAPGGYKSIPQWLNDKAHCLKCDAIVKSRPGLHGEVDLPENLQKDLSSSRAPGEASTYKASPGSAMESAGGSCSKSPNGMHHWKYGKCNYCQKGEGKFVKGAGALANPGGSGGCPKDGGKCMFKYLARKGTGCERKKHPQHQIMSFI